jgi:phospholipid N-methyltransferase
MAYSSKGITEFMKAALRDPRQVSTIFPSLRFLAQALIHHSQMGPGDSVLELGCGSGAITRHILDHRDQWASYQGVEIDSQLVEYLRQSFPGESFLQASADQLAPSIPDRSVDVVISSLPWTMFPEELQKGIIEEIVRVLKPEGRLSTFLCLHALTYPGANRVKKLFQESFSHVEKREFIARNIPPAVVYLARH